MRNPCLTHPTCRLLKVGRLPRQPGLLRAVRRAGQLQRGVLQQEQRRDDDAPRRQPVPGGDAL